MAHTQQLFFLHACRQLLPKYFRQQKVLELGSLNINGSVRQFFEDCDYTGIDVGAGVDVDLVCRAQDLGHPAESYDVTISCEMMEHNADWRRSYLNMLRLIKPDGLFIMTCATMGRRQHGTPEFMPQDSPLTVRSPQVYYRNLTETDFRSLVVHETWFSHHAFFEDRSSHDLYMFGLGHSADAEAKHRAQALTASLAKHYQQKNILGKY